MNLLFDADELLDQVPDKLRDVNSDVSQVLTYRAGFLDGADGLAPVRTAYAYDRGYQAGAMFRARISSKSQPLESHFPGYASLHKCYVLQSSGGLRQIKFPKRVLQVLAGARAHRNCGHGADT